MVPLDFPYMEAGEQLWGNRGRMEGKNKVAENVSFYTSPSQFATKLLFMRLTSAHSSLSVLGDFVRCLYVV